ncbi:FG-GAP repeat domain-containing protein [Streptomyces xanthochromogenes]|uniref:FG-GAP repeat domain-containing protein n=1 Tax=Streptomyces xanthochromogenes TaxID=67384 RepID=UPI0037BA1D47
MHHSAISSRSRTPRPSGRSRRLVTAATALVLAVTAGPLAAPALAASPASPAAAGAAEAPAAPALKIAADAEVLGAGRTGFLSIVGAGSARDVQWTRYADGGTTVLAREESKYGPAEMAYGGASDVVALTGASAVDRYSKITLRDMATGSSSVVDLGTYRYRYLGTLGSRILASKDTGQDTEVHVLEAGDQKVTDRVVTGLPSGAQDVTLESGAGDLAVLRYSHAPGGLDFWYRTAADLSSAKVVTGSGMLGDYVARAAVSPTHLAVVGGLLMADTSSSVRTKELGGEQKQWSREIGPHDGADLVGLVGGWAVYGDRHRLNEGNVYASSALRATPIGGGTERKVMDHASSIAPAPDGSLLVMGGTVADGEGLYRVSAGADGAPVAALVATAGHPTRLTLEESQVPPVAELDKGAWQPKWRLTHNNADVTVTLRHTASGAQREVELRNERGSESTEPAWQELKWDGLVGPSYAPDRSAPNGDYTWTLTAKPRNGIGPDLVETGTFKVSRKAAPHDYTDNGSPDLLRRTSWGDLTLEDTYREPEKGLLKSGPAKSIGTNWNIYDQVTAVGDVAGASAGDVVGRDRDGVLWLYLGKGDGTLDSRVKIGAGWGQYNRITAGGDVSGDGRGDLLARDGAGVLWLYKGTGNWRAPFAPRVRVGGGWDAYNEVTSVGDVAGGPGGDVVARDKDGVLWLYLGKGDGTFDSRVRIGAGWGEYAQMVGIGDSDSDGKADLFVTTDKGDSYVYRGTGSWRAPFAPRELTGLYNTWSSDTIS